MTISMTLTKMGVTHRYK